MFKGEQVAANSAHSVASQEVVAPADGYSRYFRMLLAAVYGIGFLYFMVSTIHWPLVWDATVFHYVNFLTAHGMTPYRDIFDINMPGAYILDSLQMHLFGPGDMAWRMYEYFLLISLIVAMVVIALPVEWVAGLAAGVLFAIFHATGGAMQSGQRDEAIAVLLIVGYAFLFEAVRRRQPVLMLPYGLAMSAAVGVKPTFLPLLIAVTAMALVVLRKRGEPLRGYTFYALGGCLIPAVAIAAYLIGHHATASFIDLSTRLTPYYSRLKQESITGLIRNLLPQPLFQLMLLGILVVAHNADWFKSWHKNWEQWALALGAAAGAFSFIIQRKGYDYQRYPLCVFALLLVSLEFAKALRGPRWIRWVGVFAILYGTVYLLPLYESQIPSESVRDDAAFMRSLEKDLTQLGGEQLQHRVQCLDMVDGCMGALFHLNLVQSTGFTGDTLFFVRDDAPAVAYYRSIFWNDIHRAPPKVIVLSDERYSQPRSFDKLDDWPEFKDYLEERYTLAETRVFKTGSYRLYLLKS
jgi:hypothetical protein